MNWLYLSPHLDDAVYSCGGLIWEQTQAGQKVNIWTVCTGDPPPGPLSPFAESLHTRWETGDNAGHVRRAEDHLAASRLGAETRHLNLPDCIYRRHPDSGEALYASEEAIFGELNPVEAPIIAWLSTILQNEILPGTRVVCPLTLGGHVDHHLVRTAAERADCISWFYADYPYVAQVDADVASRLPAGWAAQVTPISEGGIMAWVDAIALYSSQASTFWAGRAEMEKELRGYLQAFGGIRLWER